MALEELESAGEVSTSFQGDSCLLHSLPPVSSCLGDPFIGDVCADDTRAAVVSWFGLPLLFGDTSTFFHVVEETFLLTEPVGVVRFGLDAVCPIESVSLCFGEESADDVCESFFDLGEITGWLSSLSMDCFRRVGCIEVSVLSFDLSAGLVDFFFFFLFALFCCSRSVLEVPVESADENVSVELFKLLEPFPLLDLLIFFDCFDVSSVDPRDEVSPMDDSSPAPPLVLGPFDLSFTFFFLAFVFLDDSGDGPDKDQNGPFPSFSFFVAVVFLVDFFMGAALAESSSL